jgi:hypothetical protein
MPGMAQRQNFFSQNSQVQDSSFVPYVPGPGNHKSVSSADPSPLPFMGSNLVLEYVFVDDRHRYRYAKGKLLPLLSVLELI